MKIYKRIAEFQAKCPAITMDSEVNMGKAGKFKYASYPHIKKTIQPLLSELEMGHTDVVMLNDDGTQTLCTTVFCTDEEKLVEGDTALTSCIRLVDPNRHKEFGGSITYNKRYGLSGILGIVTEEDKDVQAIDRVKPKLSSKAFEAAQDRIMKGETGILNKCRANFDMTDIQEETLLNLELECSTS